MEHIKNSGPSTFFSFAIAFAMVFGLVGCSPSQSARPGTHAQWEGQLGWLKASRKLAESAPRCLKDRVADPRLLREEVARLEQSMGTVATEGQWQGLDLSTVTGPQAQFLKTNAHWIATDSIDFSACTDLPCIINRVYGGGTEPGWRAYYYYLVTGYSLSMRDYVPKAGGFWSDAPDQVVFNAPRSAHLFSNTELYSFLKLAALLPENYRFMGSQRFHRVPDGVQVPEISWCGSGRMDADHACICAGGKASENPDGTCNDVVKKGTCPKGFENVDGTCRVFKTSTCGDSWGGKSMGFIRVKRCLEEDNYVKRTRFYEGDDEKLADNGIRGQFYMTMTHEMTHAWDRFLGEALNPDGSLSVFSETPEWKNLSGWHEEPVIAPTGLNGVPGLISHRWVPAPGGDGFVRDYARQSPYEDLAETAAWVRFRPTLVSRRSPLKTDFLSKKLFGGRTYDPAGLTSYYIDAAVTGVLPQLLEVAQGCHASVQILSQSSSIACIEGELHNRVTIAFDQLRATEWEACDLLSEKESELRSLVLGRLSPEVSRLVSQNSDNALMTQPIFRLRAALALQVDPREAYVHCFRQAQPQLCYQQALNDAFDHTAQPFITQLGALLPAEKTNYLARHSFDQSATQTRQFYSQVLSGIKPQITALAETRWQNCLSSSQASSHSDPIVSPYSGGTHFVAADLLNCVNSGYEADLRLASGAYLARMNLNVVDTDVQAFIQGLLLPGYLEVLSAKQDRAATAEDADRERRKSRVLEVLSYELTRDRSWLTGAIKSEAAAIQCSIAANKAFNSYFSRASESLPTRFAAIEDIRNAWALEACTRVLISPVVTRELDVREEKVWNDALVKLDLAVAERARDKATDCIARHSSHTVRVSDSIAADRRRCLVAKQAWNRIELQALVDWAQSSEGRSFSFTHKKDALAYLDERRQALQTTAIKLMRARK